jgi:hypothetical protein
MNSTKFILKEGEEAIQESVSKIFQKHVQNEELEMCIRLVTEGKNTSQIKKEVLIKALKTILSSLTLEDQDEGNDQEEETHEILITQSQISQPKSTQISNERKEIRKSDDQNRPRRICRYYKKGFCKSGKTCKFDHPKMCEVFKKNGLAKFSTKGCDGKCGKLHPFACTDSLKKEECYNEKCTFFHTVATKKKMKTANMKESVKTTKNQTQPQHQNKDKAEDSFLEFQKTLTQELQSMRQQMTWMMTMIRPQTYPGVPAAPYIEAPNQGWFTNSQ